MVIYVSLISKGIILKGMRFVYLSEDTHYVNTWCVELQFHFKISKISLKRDFKANTVDI